LAGKKPVTKKSKAAPSGQGRGTVQDSLQVHAQAISDLAAAIRQHAAAVAGAVSPPPSPEGSGVQTLSRATLPPLSRAEILSGIEAVFHTNRTLGDDDEINTLFPGDPGKLVSMWEEFDNYPAFRQRGLAIGPNDLRFVKYVKELIGVIAWGLKNALRR
jgi:hypothetical protein